MYSLELSTKKAVSAIICFLYSAIIIIMLEERVDERTEIKEVTESFEAVQIEKEIEKEPIKEDQSDLPTLTTSTEPLTMIKQLQLLHSPLLQLL